MEALKDLLLMALMSLLPDSDEAAPLSMSMLADAPSEGRLLVSSALTSLMSGGVTGGDEEYLTIYGI